MKNLLHLAALLFLISGCTKPPLISLVKDGISSYSITIPLKPTEQESRAANLLQKYVKQISGCELPIKQNITPEPTSICIRETDGLKYDGYQLKSSEDGSITILGGKRKGCVYGLSLIHI